MTRSAMMSSERCTCVTGFTLSITTASTSPLSKVCVAAITTCKLQSSTTKAPDRVSASSNCIVLLFSSLSSSSPSVVSKGDFDSRDAIDFFFHLLPAVTIVGLTAFELSIASSRLSSSAGISV
eukprot:CAMPEP_0181309228 /NCGR_PEP_ID=MMETSP1101-20121128/11901_1 /TAXON_ID=46948 /ORGANISM="Rhodomonas abbreviata, Strain Caron Lab Isolate" /LENGTH=122 /DNA_ID=CAMNT_0023415697 /DNA_START=349 /DNA_END=717 /DNA_ORIENTATION=+